MVNKKTKKNEVAKLNKKIAELQKTVKIQKFDNFFLLLLLFILIMEILLISPYTSEIIRKIPMIYLTVFYFLVFLFPLWILFSYYFKVIRKNKECVATKVLVNSLTSGFIYFAIFISVLAFLVLEVKEIAILFVSEIFIQMAVLIGLAVVIFSFLLKLYLFQSNKLRISNCKNGN